MIALLVFISVTMAAYGALTMIFWQPVRLRERVFAVTYQDEVKEAQRSEIVARDGVKKRYLSSYLVQRVKKDLDSVGVTLTVKEVQTVALLCLMMMIVGWFLFHGVFGVVLVGLVLVLGYRFWLVRRRKLRIRDLEEGLGDMVTIASGALRAGYSFLQTVDILSQETKGRLADEFRRMLREMSFGISIEDALAHADHRIQSLDFSLIINAILIQRQVGGNLAEVLEIAGDTIRERIRIQGEIRTLTAQGRLSMWIFMALTPTIGILLYLFNAVYIVSLFTSGMGLFMLFIAIIGQIIGMTIIRRIVNIEV